MSTATDFKPQIDLDKEIMPSVDNAKNFVITTNEQNLAAQDLDTSLKQLQKKIEEEFAGPCDDAHKLWKKMVAWRDSHLKPIQEARAAISKKCGQWIADQRAKQEQAERDAEAKRQEEERKQQEKINAQADKAAASGKTEKAEALREKAQNVQIAPAYVPPAVQTKVAGVATVTKWKGEVVDFLALIAFISENPEYAHMLEVKQSAVNLEAQRLKGMKQIPGIKFSQETTLSNRR